LVFDASGNLYGTTIYGGSQGSNCVETCGTVFELSPNSSGGWTETVLYAFTGLGDGYSPWSGVVFDATGKLYGTTSNGNGAVFQLSPSSTGWTIDVIFGFGGSTGYSALGNLVFDKAGNLYGTTELVSPKRSLWHGLGTVAPEHRDYRPMGQPVWHNWRLLWSPDCLQTESLQYRMDVRAFALSSRYYARTLGSGHCRQSLWHHTKWWGEIGLRLGV
jgi:hypothetical protein